MSEPVYRIPDDLVFLDVLAAGAAPPTNWGVAAMFLQALYDAGGDGEGEVVAVCDTGVDAGHPEFAGRWLSAPKSFVPGESAYDGHGHGTHVLGTAAGSTFGIGGGSKAKVIANKCLSNGGSGAETWINSAVQDAFDQGATVISLSIGGGGSTAESAALYKRIADSGRCVVVVASGNERQQGGQTTFPARYPGNLPVAAVDPNGRYASFSNPGQTSGTLAISAPGTNIWSAKPGGGYQQMSGTSMATPHAARIVSGIQSARAKRGLKRLSAAQVYQLFQVRAADAGPAGADRDYGPGLIDCRLLVNSLVSIPEVIG